MNRVSNADHSDAVSLFPFLAVLLCTMGALIVLLVVMARQSRLQAAQSAATPSPEAAAARPFDGEKLDLQVAELEQIRGNLSQQLKDNRRRLQHWEAHMRRLSEQLVQLERQAQQLEEVRQGQLVDRDQAESEDARLKQLIAQTRADLEKAEKEAQGRPKSYAIIPYRGVNETYRRPLYIECLADAVILQPEGIRLEEADFFEPLGPNNPLAAALRAASEYYANVDRRRKNSIESNDSKTVDSEEPYPLLLVRPQGIELYYKARRAIASWNRQFGYEMIERDWELALPPPNPDLSAVEYRAVEEARALRRHLVRSAQLHSKPISGGSRPGRFRATNHSGGFEREDGNAEDDWADEGFGPGSFAARRSLEGLAAADNPNSRDHSSPRDSGEDSKSSQDAESLDESLNDADAKNGASADGQQASNANESASESTPDGSPVGSLADTRGQGWAVRADKRGAGRGAVPISRPIHVVCRADRIAILADNRTRGLAHSYTEPTSSDSKHVVLLRAETAGAIDRFMSVVQNHVASWGIAGKNLYWRPQLVLHVAPDGRRRADDLQALLRGSGLSVKRAPGGTP